MNKDPQVSVVKKIWAILSPTQRSSVLVLLVLMVVGMFMEIIGIGMVIPVISLTMQDDLSSRYPIVESAIHLLGNLSQVQLVTVGMILLVCIYFIKTIYLVFLVWRQMQFVFNVQANLSQSLFTQYLRQPYIFHLQRNSAQLIRNVITEVSIFARAGLNAVMLLLTEGLVLLGIVTLLVIIEPFGALVLVALFGTAGWVYHRLTASRVLKWGKARLWYEGLRLQHLQQGLGGVKDVKLLGRESGFLAQYEFHNVSCARAGQYHTTLQQLPRLWLELIAVIGLAALVLAMTWQGYQLDAVIPTLAVFAAAAFRLMPSTNRVISSIQSVRYTLPVINTLYDELNLLHGNHKTQSIQKFSYESMITLEQLTFRYPASATDALNNINLSIPIGTMIGFIGGSGSGKSTLVDTILGLLTPDDGFVKIDNIDIQSNLRGWQDLIGYVPQSIFLTDDTLRRNVAFGLLDEKIDKNVVMHAIKDAQLEEFVKSLPLGIETVVGERGIKLSGGQKQRIGIARALYHNPEVLILDEATSSLDTITEKGVMQSVTALHGKKTIIIIAHRLSTVENCDRLYKLDKGKLIDEGIPELVILNNK